MSLDASYRHCRDVARRNGTTFFLATRLLPRGRRRHVHALYAFARTADDLVDEPPPGVDPANALDRLEDRLHAALDEPPGTLQPDPILAAVVDTIRTFDIPRSCVDRFLSSMRMDLTITTYDTWDDLLRYMDGSAAVIGEMLLPLLDPVDRDAALGPARALGLAFQLTNFLRDVGDDLDRGRQYLPQADLRRFDVDLIRRRVDPSFEALMRFEIDRGRELYATAGHGIALLPRRSRLAIGSARVMYAAILDEIVAGGFDVFATRATVPTTKRLRLLVREVARLWR